MRGRWINSHATRPEDFEGEALIPRIVYNTNGMVDEFAEQGAYFRQTVDACAKQQG